MFWLCEHKRTLSSTKGQEKDVVKQIAAIFSVFLSSFCCCWYFSFSCRIILLPWQNLSF